MSVSIFFLASVIYWGVYVMAFVIGIPVALGLLFGVLQTAKWFLKGGKTNPHRHTSRSKT